jgi:beta-hydroxylase
MWMITLSIVVTLILLVGWSYYVPQSMLLPVNLMLRTDSVPRPTIYSDTERDQLFPGGTDLVSRWKELRQEGEAVYTSLAGERINYLDRYQIDLDQEDKSNWTAAAIQLFGIRQPRFAGQCPVLTSILDQHPEILSATFSIMEPGKIIAPHVGPYDGILRYQLPLVVPDGECYLYVEDRKWYWKEGEPVLFDETYSHGAVNNTGQRRLVLLVDLARPYHWGPFRALNRKILEKIGGLGD